MTTTPNCCGQKMTQERMDFYLCQQCNGEAIWSAEYNCWEYECPHSLDPNFGYGRRLDERTNVEVFADSCECEHRAA